MSAGSEIISWYQNNKRDLPWRHTSDPYKIWLSEIILQQTRVEQGLPYYHRFIEEFPDARSLASAKEEKVLKLWQGLGYYSRARNLHKAAKKIATDFGGKFPADYHTILSLPGIGSYTAAAIASFAFGKRHPVVDGNVFRLVTRLFGIKTPIDSVAGKKEISGICDEIMGDFPPAIFNQAIMEFGAIVCKPSGPQCNVCPLSISCIARSKGMVDSFPVKKNKTKIRERYFNYVVLHHKNSFWLKKRGSGDIWQGLHDFPLIETVSRKKEAAILKSSELKKMIGQGKITNWEVSREYKHILSHQHIYAKFYRIEAVVPVLNESASGWKKVSKETVGKIAVPRLIENYLEESGIIR